MPVTKDLAHSLGHNLQYQKGVDNEKPCLTRGGKKASKELGCEGLAREGRYARRCPTSGESIPSMRDTRLVACYFFRLGFKARWAVFNVKSSGGSRVVYLAAPVRPILSIRELGEEGGGGRGDSF